MPFLAPVFGAIGTAIAGVTSFLAGGSIAAQIAMAGLAVAAQYAVQRLFGPPRQPAQASQLETRYGENLVRSVILGKVGTAGHHVYRNAHGRGNAIIQDVYVLSHFRINGVTRVRFNGEWRTLGGTVNAERGQRIQGIGSAEIWVKVYTGALDQAADAGLIARSNGPGRWTADHRGAGIAYAIVTSVLHREHLTGPWDAFFEVEGAPLYDWRRDDTAGGEGNHRWNDQTTWQYGSGIGTNPILQAYALERGLFNGTEMMVGKGTPAASLPLARWTVAANICDEIVVGERRYQASAIASSGEGVTHDANLQPLLEACAGSWVELAGEEYPIVGANQTPVTTITDGDIIQGEPFRLSLRRTRSELVNTVAGSYVDPTTYYQSVPFTTRIDEAALAIDGERLAVSIPYRAVTVPACVDRLADIAIRASRYEANAEICVRPKFLALRPGQWITWQSARFGFTRQFQVLSKRLGALGPAGARNVYLALQEVGEGVFDPTAYETLPPATTPQGSPDYLSQVSDFLAAGSSVVDPATGTQYPAIRLSWSAIDDPTVIGVEIQWRPQFQPEATLSKTVPADQLITILADGVVSASVFEVRTRLVTSPARAAPWSDWVAVTTPHAPRTDVLVGLAQTREDLYALIRQLHATFDQVAGRMEQLALAASDAAGVQASESAVAVRFRDATAVVLQQITAAISDEDGELIAVAEALTGVQATVANLFAEGLFKVEARAGGGDVLARIVLMARAGIEDDFQDAGLVLEVFSDGEEPPVIRSRVVVHAEQFVVTDGDENTLPLVFEGGELKLENIRLGTLFFDQLQSTNEKLQMKGFGDEASIEVFT